MTSKTITIDDTLDAYAEIRDKLIKRHLSASATPWLLQVVATNAQTTAIQEQTAAATLAVEQLREINLSLLMLFNQGGPSA